MAHNDPARSRSGPEPVEGTLRLRRIMRRAAAGALELRERYGYVDNPLMHAPKLKSAKGLTTYLYRLLLLPSDFFFIFTEEDRITKLSRGIGASAIRCCYVATLRGVPSVASGAERTRPRLPRRT